MKWLLPVLFFSFSQIAFATANVQAFNGPFTFTTSQLGVPGQTVTVALGFGDGSCTSSTFCDTCATATCSPPNFCVCNPHQVGNSTLVTIQFTSDNTTAGAVAAVGTSSAQPYTLIPTVPYQGAGGTNTITATLGQLCQAATSGSASPGDCTSVIAGTLTNFVVGVSNGTTMVDYVTISLQILNPTSTIVDDCTGTNSLSQSDTSFGGICNFRARAGDSSIYLTDVSGDANYPGTFIAGVRVYYSTNSFDDAAPGTGAPSSDFTLGVGGTINGGIITGLQNDGPIYHVRMAMIDTAGDVFNFISDTNITSADFGNCTGLTAPYTVSDPTSACRYKAKPDVVAGMLEKDMNCFIATAAYGSSLEPKLNTFRKFRSEFLNYSTFGKKFIYSYYHWGPYAARWIADRDWARATARVGLWPMWAFSETAIQIGLDKAIALALMSLVGFIGLIAAFISWIRTPRAKSP